MNELERLRQIEKQSIAEGLLDDLKALLGKVGIGQSDADKIAADAEKAAKAAGAAEEEVMSQDVKPSKEWAIMPNGKRGNFNIDRSLPYVDTVKNGKKERTYADKAALQKMFGQDAQIQGITDTGAGADQATGDVGADGMTNAERDSGAGVGLDAFGGSGEQQAAATAGPDDGTRGGQQPNAPTDQKKNVETKLKRYKELLDKAAKAAKQGNSSKADQAAPSQTMMASTDFRHLIAIVESAMLNENLSDAEMKELDALHNELKGMVGIDQNLDNLIVDQLNRYLKYKQSLEKGASTNQAKEKPQKQGQAAPQPNSPQNNMGYGNDPQGEFGSGQSQGLQPNSPQNNMGYGNDPQGEFGSGQSQGLQPNSPQNNMGYGNDPQGEFGSGQSQGFQANSPQNNMGYGNDPQGEFGSGQPAQQQPAQQQPAAQSAGPDDGTRGGQQPNAPAQQQPAAPQQQKYTVKPGDNLTKIAKAKGVKVQDVIKANPQITNPNLIYPNQEINIPAKAGESMIGNNRRNSRKMNEASMNISMNGSTAAEVAELVAILKNAGMDHSSTMAMAMEPEPEMMGPEPCSTCGKVHGPEMPSPCGMGEETVGEEWDNAPDEDYRDDDYMIHDLSGGLNRKKKAYAKAQDGDNAMAVREQLMREWKKTKLG